MGDIVQTPAREAEIAIAVEAQAPIERIDLLNGAEIVATRRCYTAAELGTRIRITWQGAERRGRGRQSSWQGSAALHGATITRMEPINHWNPERLLHLRDVATLEFDTITTGNFGGADLWLDRIEDTRLDIRTNHVAGEIALHALGVEDVRLDAGALDRAITVKRLPERLTRHALATTAPVTLTPGRDNPIWVRVSTIDGHRAWSSPIYLVPT